MPEEPQPVRVKIKFGDLPEIALLAYETSAPKDYDGFQTFTIAQLGRDRIVLVREEHAQWQLARYQSGVHLVQPALCEAQAIIDELWKRMRCERAAGSP